MKTSGKQAASNELGKNLGWPYRLLRAVVQPFRGSAPGATVIEYLVVTGFVALFAIIAFNRFGQTMRQAYRAEAQHIQGRGLPGAADILSDLGGLTDPDGLCDLSTGVCIGGGCFAAGTPVATEKGDRAIETIVPGDRVWARDPETGAVQLRTVTKTWIRRTAPVITLDLRKNGLTSERLKVTGDHRFWVEGTGWTPASQLDTTPLWSANTAVVADVLSPEATEITTVYNLEVEGFHTYFVGHSHALVHNQTGNPGNPNNCGNPQPPGGNPVMPNGLSEADQQLWKECNQLHISYKATQARDAAFATDWWRDTSDALQNNRGSEQDRFDFCNALTERIEIVEQLHAGRNRYLNRGCDKFDWFNQGRTQAEREAAHRGQLEQTSNQIKKMRDQKKALCKNVP